MKTIFIPTVNYQRFEVLCQELLETPTGIEMAVVVGPPGRGKSTAASRIVTINGSTTYVYFEPRLSLVGLIREITFAVAGVRHRSTQACIDVINGEMAKFRRLVIVDESDQMSLKLLNQLRAFHDLRNIPIVLIGEESLVNKLARERRLISRIRAVVKFEPVSHSDVVIFYRKALELKLTPEHATQLLRHSNGDFRRVIGDANKIEGIMKTNGFKNLNDHVIRKVCGEESEALPYRCH